MNLNMLLKLGNLICAYTDFAKFIYKILDIGNQQNNNNNNNNTYMYTKIHICLGKSEYHNCFSRLPYVVYSLFLVWLFVGIYGVYLKFDLGPLGLISISFINIAIVL